MRRWGCLLATLVACDGTGVMPTGDGRMIDGALPPGTYAAYNIIGGLNRIRIAKLTTDTCFAIQLANPGTNTGAVSVPTDWFFEFGRAMQPAAACDPRFLGPVTNMFDASDAVGSITWQGAQPPPRIDDVSVTLTFANHPSWCPASTTLTTANLAVM